MDDEFEPQDRVSELESRVAWLEQQVDFLRKQLYEQGTGAWLQAVENHTGPQSPRNRATLERILDRRRRVKEETTSMFQQGQPPPQV